MDPHGDQPQRPHGRDSVVESNPRRRLEAGEDAPPLAKFFAGASLFLWIAVMYFARLIPSGKFQP